MKALKAKIFNHSTENINLPNELQLNAWLAEHPGVDIVHTLQSESMTVADNGVQRNLTITLIYREPPD
ncbi:hypothetical protein [Desulfatitalea alkaliphila]|uniref:Uncharacterized protein n=1 Tax=Desulfatitalea alkaliphila TaxID=2929485 RepID=A0AA41R0B6_9BACT|nr:hypothetical protein [Desulfatitalea alkaliphila]MCJ8499539.1 hypothetical protein [Desulfatitalea alkaliphila]